MEGVPNWELNSGKINIHLRQQRHWLRLPGLGNNNEKLGLPERLSAGIQFRFRNLFHVKILGNCNYLVLLLP